MTDYEIAERLEQAITAKVCQDEYLEHHGIPNMKWGVRRWQNEDGSLTPEGRIHYGYGKDGAQSKRGKQLEKYSQKEWDKMNKRYDRIDKRTAKNLEKAETKYKQNPNENTYQKLEDAMTQKIDAAEKRKILSAKIDDLEVDDMLHEKRIVGQMWLNAARGLYTIDLNDPDLRVDYIPDNTKTKENMRLGGANNQINRVSASRQKAREELKKR